MAEKAWRCGTCGYVHRGPQPPDVCPVCGAPGEQFEPYLEPAAPATELVARQWQCLNCNHVHDGSQPPAACQVCGAPADRFDTVKSAAPAPGAAGGTASVVIVGGGIAGVSAAESVRAAAPAAAITLIAEEKHPPYYRLNLTRYLAGEITDGALPLHPPAWYDEMRVDLIRGQTVSALDLVEHRVVLADGRVLPFEKLIVATGAHPFVPSLPGVELDGVCSLRTCDDAVRIVERVLAGAPLVCIGGGVLGIEACAGLARRGADVTLLESYGWLMPRQMNREAGDLLEAHVRSTGVKLRKNVRTARIAGQGRAAGVQLEDGSTIPAGVVLLATGVRPNTHLARRAGLQVNKGILVDNYLRTSHPDVYAAGDVAEHNGQLYGVWAASQYEGSIAGLNAAGVPTLFGGLPRSNAVKILDIDAISIGVFEPPDGSYPVFDHRAGDDYFHFVFHDGLMVGAVLLGKATVGPAAKKAIEGQKDFSGLLAGRPSGLDVVRALES